MGPFTTGEVPASPNSWAILHDDGTPWDLTVYDTITPVIVEPDGTSVQSFGAGSTMYSPPDTSSLNNIYVVWGAPSIFTQEGKYRLQFRMAKSDGTLDFSNVVEFDVEPAESDDPTIYWCTLNDVLQITGQSATEDELSAAQGIIDIVTHRTTDNISRVKPRDLKYLKRALAYQTIWQRNQPDLFTKVAFDGVSQDGFSGKLLNKSGLYLGPLAEKALKNCSWLRTRSLRTSNPFVDGDYDMALNPLADDSILDWELL